jgi:hypothetical protein
MKLACIDVDISQKEGFLLEVRWGRGTEACEAAGDASGHYSKTEPTDAQCYCLFIYLFCSSSPRHVSARNYAIIKVTILI